MKLNASPRLIIFLIVLSLVIFCSSAVFAGGSFTFKWGNKSEAEDSQVTQKPKHQKRNGPPSHAPAHGYRAKYQYRYYPAKKIYHDSKRGLYFYIKGDNWEVGASLPSHLKNNLGSSVTIEMDTNKPYIHNGKHIETYPPAKYKAHKQKKWAKKKK